MIYKITLPFYKYWINKLHGFSYSQICHLMWIIHDYSGSYMKLHKLHKLYKLQNPRTQKSSHCKSSSKRPLAFTTCAEIGSHITFPGLSILIAKMGIKTSIFQILLNWKMIYMSVLNIKKVLNKYYLDILPEISMIPSWKQL